MRERIDKRKLWRLINKKTKSIVQSYHVFSVIQILFEELLIDLKAGKKIKIHNFGTLSLKKFKSRVYMHIITKEIAESEGRRKLLFKISAKLKDKILKYIDLDSVQ